MVRPALSATRGIDVIDFLAAFPGRAFTLSEIAKAVKINLASCHAILSALTAQGYLARGIAQKTYTLGPALVAVGHAALLSQPLLGRARRTAEELVAEHDIPVMLSTVVGDEILCVASVPDQTGRPAGMAIGERRPMVPPIGAPFLAWANDDAEVEKWIANHTPPISDDQIDSWRRTLALTRSRGFQVTLRTEDSPPFASLMSELASARPIPSYKDEVTRLFNTLDYQLSQPDRIDPDTPYSVTLIAAPIFDRAGAVAYNLCFTGIREALPGQRVLELADRLVRACLQIMREDRGTA